MNYLKQIKNELSEVAQTLEYLNDRLEALDLAVEGYLEQEEASTPFPVELAPETAIFIEDLQALKAGEADSLTEDNSISAAFTEEGLAYYYNQEQEELYNIYSI